VCPCATLCVRGKCVSYILSKREKRVRGTLPNRLIFFCSAAPSYNNNKKQSRCFIYGGKARKSLKIPGAHGLNRDEREGEEWGNARSAPTQPHHWLHVRHSVTQVIH